MRRIAPTAGRAVGVLSILLLVPLALAQAPSPTEVERSFVGFALVAPNAYVETDYLVTATTSVIIKDLSRDSAAFPELPGGGAGVSPVAHAVFLSVKEVRPPEALGWQILLETFKPTVGGEEVEALVRFTPTVQINVPQISVDIEGVYEHPNGFTYNQTVTLTARVRPYTNMAVQVANPVERVGQFETLRYEVRVTNGGVYPETFYVRANADKADIRVLSPPGLIVMPGETRSAYISVLTPPGPPYELGRSSVITMQVQSERGPMIPQVATLQIRGPYVPVYWLPITLVGLVAVGVVTAKARERGEMRRLEKGRPRRLRPTPRQAVLLKELKAKDPEAHKTRIAQMAAIYATRRASFKDAHKERLANDREERKVARAEFREKRKAQAIERKEARKRAKVERKEAAVAAKAQRKLDKQNAKVEAKEVKARGKQLAKTKKQLEKARVKQAKIDAKQAKADAKREAAEAKARAKAEKAAAKNKTR